jgi:hypothetical protein
MLLMPQIQDLHNHLKILDELFKDYYEKNVDFRNRSQKWLDETDKLLTSLKIDSDTQIILAKAKLAHNLIGGLDNERKTNRTRKNSFIAQTLIEIGEILQKEYAREISNIQAGEILARQMASIANYLNISIDMSKEWNEVELQWKCICDTKQLLEIAIQLNGLLGKHNAILLFIREYSRI